MITVLRRYAPQASSIRHAKRLLSPSTLRRYRRFNCEPSFFRRPYSTELEHAAPLENGPAPSAEIQSDEPRYSVVRGGFGDEDENIQEDSRPARAGNQRRAGKSQFEGLRQVEPANIGTSTSEKTSSEIEQQRAKEDSYASDPWLSTLGDEPGETASPPDNTFKRTTQEDVLSICTYTPWRMGTKWHCLHRGFEFVDFRSARSFIIEAMNLKESLKAHLELSNFGRLVYTRIGSANAEGTQWSISDEDVDLGWALQKAAKKYLGRWQMDAAAQPMADLGFAASWRTTTKLIVPASERWHHLLDLRKPPIGWLTMEYRQLSQLGITASEVVEALVNQIADDLSKKEKGEKDMAFPVWCITDRTLAVSQTEFFSIQASISKPGDGTLMLRETVVLHRNFNLEQFNAMVTKEHASLKSIEDGIEVGSLLRMATSKWNRATSDLRSGPMSTSAKEVYLKQWGPIMTKELQPLVRRVLAKEIKEHSAHVQALSEIYSKEKILAALEDQSSEEKDWRQAHAEIAKPLNWQAAKWKEGKMQHDEERKQRLESQRAPGLDARVPKGFGSLVHMLREKLDDPNSQDVRRDPNSQDVRRDPNSQDVRRDPNNQDLGRDPNELVVRPVRTIASDVTDDTRWRKQYLKLREVVEANQKERQSRQTTTHSPRNKTLNNALVDILSRVGFRGEPIDWRARYYELRRSAYSLGLRFEIYPVPDALEYARREATAKGKEEAAKKNSRKLGLHWGSDKGFSRNGELNIKRFEALGRHTRRQAREDDASSQLDEKDYNDIFEGYTANRRTGIKRKCPKSPEERPKGPEERPKGPEELPQGRVFYHWLPGEKLNLNNSSAVEANVTQMWRPEQWKGSRAKLTDKISLPASPKGNPEPLTPSPRPESDASPLTAHRDPDDAYVRPLKSDVAYVHWLPGDSFVRDREGHIMPPPRVDNAKELLEAKRRQVMDRELWEAQEKMDSLSALRKPLGMSRMVHDSSGAPSFFDGEAGADEEAESEAGQFMRSAREPVRAEVATGAAQPEPQPDLPPHESLSSEEDEAGNVGHLNNADAEKLLAEVGIDAEESKGSETTTAEGEVAGDGQKEGEAQREAEGRESEETKPKETDPHQLS
ncbi:hypothetical protein IWX90DRAFT_422776 [Phyllosticta citrichinensis]|uniref:4a-hydroxytetrahydrobiopterin dehydratase n=1 Tax=Phyllosticta citrichinensis TaxID=1130410 RepID=A0ABR1Y8U0_9PEZI